MLILSVGATAQGWAAQDAVYYFTLAKMLAGEGSWGAALEQFQRAVREDPDDPYLHIEFAEFLHRIRRLAQAAEEARRAAELAPEDPDILRSYGQIHLSLVGIDPEAIDRAREALEGVRRQRPDDIQSMFSLGQIYLRMEAPEKAAQVFEEVVRYHPNNRELTSLLLDALDKAGNAKRAIEVLAEVVRLDPDASQHRLELVRLLSEQGRHQEALEVLQAAPAETRAELEYSSLLARELLATALDLPSGHVQRNEALARALINLDSVLDEKPNDLDGMFLKVRILIAQMRRDEAMTELRKLRDLVPKNPMVNRTLAELLQEQGQRAEAVELLTDLVRDIDKANPAAADELRLDIALIHARSQQWDEVVKLSASRAEVAEEPLRSIFVRLHVDGLVKLGRGKEALKVLDRYAARGEPSAALQVKRAEVLLELKREPQAHDLLQQIAADDGIENLVLVAQFYLFQHQDFARSIPLLERALAHDDDLSPEQLVELQFLLGQAHERNGEPEKAEAFFLQVLDSQPDHSTTLNYLGYMWADQGENLEEALSLVQRAVALEPDNGAYVDSLGWALFRLGHFQDAQRHLERAAELVPGDATILEHLGDVYVVLRRFDKAKQSYKRAVEVNDEENVDQVRRKLANLEGGS